MDKTPSKAAVNQKKYRDKVKQINQENATIVAYVKQRTPWVIKEFFEKGKVRVIPMKN